MKVSGHKRTAYAKPRWIGLFPAIIIIIIAFFTFPFPASSMLGGDASSVQTDQLHMKGSIRARQTGTVAIHEITAPSGIIVREFVSPTGVVFGVAWEGPYVPDLQQLLGTYFSSYASEAKSERARHVGRRPLNIQRSGIVIQTGGHMRAFFGRVYVPGLIPQGVDANVIR